MKQAIFSLVTAIWFFAVSFAHADSMLYEVTPENGKAAGFMFDITTDNLPDGIVKFRVVISEKEAKFINTSTSLSVVRMRDNGWSVSPVRQLASERLAHSIVCVFYVEQPSWDDPALCFVFTHMPAPMPSADIVYARLKNFVVRYPDAFKLSAADLVEREREREKEILAAYRNRYPERPGGANFRPTHRAIEKARKQREAVAWLRQSGASVEHDYEKDVGTSRDPAVSLINSWSSAGRRYDSNIPKLLGIDFDSYSEVVLVYLCNEQVSDITPLARLTSLKWLLLDSTQMRDLTPLAGLTSLKRLGLRHTPVSDVTPLAGLTSLTTLDLCFTQVSDVTPLAGLTGLEVLGLADTQVSDLRPLAGLTSLVALSLPGTQVTDVTPLSGLTNLRILDLRVTQVTDVKPLARLTNLEMLHLNTMQVSQEDYEMLKKALPNCDIRWGWDDPHQD